MIGMPLLLAISSLVQNLFSAPLTIFISLWIALWAPLLWATNTVRRMHRVRMTSQCDACITSVTRNPKVRLLVQWNLVTTPELGWRMFCRGCWSRTWDHCRSINLVRPLRFQHWIHLGLLWGRRSSHRSSWRNSLSGAVWTGTIHRCRRNDPWCAVGSNRTLRTYIRCYLGRWAALANLADTTSLSDKV